MKLLWMLLVLVLIIILSILAAIAGIVIVILAFFPYVKGKIEQKIRLRRHRARNTRLADRLTS
jgi:hypothetical protein